MSAIAGTKRTAKQLVDGTIAVTVHIEPRDAAEFWRMFPSVDTPCAIAPLVNDFERLPQPEDKPKGGALCTLAARWCKDQMFQQWVGVDNEQEAASFIRDTCSIKSRSELDHDHQASERFNDIFRVPFMSFLKTNLKESNVQ